VASGCQVRLQAIQRLAGDRIAETECQITRHFDLCPPEKLDVEVVDADPTRLGDDRLRGRRDSTDGDNLVLEDIAKLPLAAALGVQDVLAAVGRSCRRLTRPRVRSVPGWTCSKVARSARFAISCMCPLCVRAEVANWAAGARVGHLDDTCVCTPGRV
jgi:hypothetical protein